MAGLIAVKGVLYGTTSGFGESENGTVFAITTAGKERVLHTFRGRNGTRLTDGANPDAGLIAMNGFLYGTTSGGDTRNTGTVFEVSTSGQERVIYSFGQRGAPDGFLPEAGLTVLNGELYGTTVGGGVPITASTASSSQSTAPAGNAFFTASPVTAMRMALRRGRP
jgi:uncharacterized repeat protein (TIGR03803 family)